MAERRHIQFASAHQPENQNRQNLQAHKNILHPRPAQPHLPAVVAAH
jgi:hypothetical protein